jgi:cell wall assembly regulator SMI1
MLPAVDEPWFPDVDESWDIIVDWLGEYCPSEVARIRPPAAEADIRAAERSLGTSLPDDLVAWWRLADGQEGVMGHLLPPYYRPYSVHEALESRSSWMRSWNAVAERLGPEEDFAAYVAAQDRAPAGSPCNGAWLPRWLAIAGSGLGNDLFVDLRPGLAHGCVRRFLNDAGASDVVLWDGVAEMLAEVANALVHEAPIDGHRIWVDDDGAICWDRDADRWVHLGPRGADLAKLREQYEVFVAELRAGGFGPPSAGSWAAEWIAAHVARNTELLIATTHAVLADNPVGRERQRHEAWTTQDWSRFREVRASAERAAKGIRYDNSDAMSPVTLDRYARDGLAALTDRISQLGARLCDLAEPLNQGRPTAHVRIVDAGATVVNRQESWLRVLNGLRARQLPLRTRQLRALR